MCEMGLSGVGQLRGKMSSAIPQGGQETLLRGSEVGTDLKAEEWLGRCSCERGKGLEQGRT